MPQNNGSKLPEETLRLILTYRRGEVSLDQVIRIPMRLMPSDELPERKPDEKLSGFWYELRTREGQVRYRRIIENPIRTQVDLPNERDPSRLVHFEALPDEKVFVLDVPAFPDGERLVLFSSPLDRPSVSQPAEARWEIPLRGDER